MQNNSIKNVKGKQIWSSVDYNDTILIPAAYYYYCKIILIGKKVKNKRTFPA